MTNADICDLININNIEEIREYYSENEHIGKSMYYNIPYLMDNYLPNLSEK